MNIRILFERLASAVPGHAGTSRAPVYEATFNASDKRPDGCNGAMPGVPGSHLRFYDRLPVKAEREAIRKADLANEPVVLK